MGEERAAPPGRRSRRAAGQFPIVTVDDDAIAGFRGGLGAAIGNGWVIPTDDAISTVDFATAPSTPTGALYLGGAPARYSPVRRG